MQAITQNKIEVGVSAGITTRSQLDPAYARFVNRAIHDHLTQDERRTTYHTNYNKECQFAGDRVTIYQGRTGNLLVVRADESGYWQGGAA